MANILVVDDELGIRDLLSEILFDEGHQVELAENAAKARDARLRMRPDLVLLDIWMPDVDGITLLKEWSKTGQLTMPVVMMSGHATIDTAVEATRIGALTATQHAASNNQRDQRLKNNERIHRQRGVRPEAVATNSSPPRPVPLLARNALGNLGPLAEVVGLRLNKAGV